MTETIIPRQLLKYSDDESAQERSDREDLELAAANVRRSETRFSRYFGFSLSGEQITAAKKFSDDLEASIRSGNATPSYDGVPPPPNCGPKDGPTDHILDAIERIRFCRNAIADTGPHAYDLYYLLERALMEDLTAVDIGRICARIAHKSWKKRRAQQVGLNVIDEATRAIIPVYNRKREH